VSYSFQVRKKNGTLELVTDYVQLEAVAGHVPDGAVFTISGHMPSEDTSKVGTVAVQLVTVDADQHTFVADARGSYNTEE
jgi:hypothetical protein